MDFTKPLLAATVAMAPLAAMSDEGPPPKDSKSIVEIVTSLEEKDYGPITEVSFDDRVWEVETYHADETLELAIDPKSGEIISEHRDDAGPCPPKDALPLSKLLRKLEEAGHGEIEEISFERRYWEVETYRGNEKRELHVDPKTGDVISDRHDD